MRIFKRKWSVVSGQWSVIRDKWSVVSGQKRKNHSPLTTGFTLIELMAVVAIIMVLAAIMIPNVAKNVERGRVAKASADIDILVKAISLFQIDHEGDLPGTLDELLKKEGQYGPYISDPKISETPWHTTYEYIPGPDSYTISATDKNGNEKFSKTINF